jgi:ketosteroid isomerase-like protein
MAASRDFDAVVEESHRALGEFVKGDPEPLKALYSHRDDVSLANPWGPALRGWKPAAAAMERAASMYKDGEVVGFERVAKDVTTDLGYIVEVERYKTKVGGSEDLASVALRVTSILRLEDETWKIVHRHADPIMTARPPESVVQK